jgi:hypothetical protein
MALDFPRFRSKKRDIETDISRVLPIRDSVAAALRESERELTQLTRRLKEANTQAAFLFGNELESDTGNDPDKEARLKEAEAFLVRGQRRASYLERQVVILREIAANIERIVTPVTAVSD